MSSHLESWQKRPCGLRKCNKNVTRRGRISSLSGLQEHITGEYTSTSICNRAVNYVRGLNLCTLISSKLTYKWLPLNDQHLVTIYVLYYMYNLQPSRGNFFSCLFVSCCCCRRSCCWCCCVLYACAFRVIAETVTIMSKHKHSIYAFCILNCTLYMCLDGNVLWSRIGIWLNLWLMFLPLTNATRVCSPTSARGHQVEQQRFLRILQFRPTE